LTIKLTQHVAARARPDSHRDTLASRVRKSSPFHSRYSRICGCASRPDEWERAAHLPASSVVKERSLHSRWSAELFWEPLSRK